MNKNDGSHFCASVLGNKLHIFTFSVIFSIFKSQQMLEYSTPRFRMRSVKVEGRMMMISEVVKWRRSLFLRRTSVGLLNLILDVIHDRVEDFRFDEGEEILE